MNFSIGNYSFPMDPMDSIGTTFYPLIQTIIIIIYKSQSRTENELFNWNLFVSNGSNGLSPLERHSTPSNNMSGIFLSLSRIGNVFSIGIYSCVLSNGSPTLGRMFHHYSDFRFSNGMQGDTTGV